LSDPSTGKAGPWTVRKADGTEIRVPNRGLLESWILAGVVEPDDKVARPGEDTFISVRDLADVSAAVETGAVVHGPKTVPTHPPIFAVMEGEDGPDTQPPPVPGGPATDPNEVVDLEPLDLDPLEGDTLQDEEVLRGEIPTALEAADTRMADVVDQLIAPNYPTGPLQEAGRSPDQGGETDGHPLVPSETFTLDEMIPDLGPAEHAADASPRTGRVAVGPTTLAPLVVAGHYVADQAVDPSIDPSAALPRIDADGRVMAPPTQAPRSGRIAIKATDIDASRGPEDLETTYPQQAAIVEEAPQAPLERSDKLPKASERPTAPSVPPAKARPDLDLQPQTGGTAQPRALSQTLTNAPAAGSPQALSRPLHRAGAMGGQSSDDAATLTIDRGRSHVGWILTILLLAAVGAGVAYWMNQAPGTAPADAMEIDPSAKAPAPAAGEAPAEDAPKPAALAEAQPPAPLAPKAPAPKDPSAEPAGAKVALDEAAAAIDEEIDAEAAKAPAPTAALEPATKAKAKAATKAKAKAAGGGVASAPKSFEALMRLAKKTAKSNKSRALKLYKMALAMRPSSPDALVNVGKQQLKTGQGGAAVSTLERCRKARPRYTPCMYWLGLAHQRSGRQGEAKKAFEAYLDVNPDGSLAADVRKRLGL
jgi:hypothetical protein